MSTGKEPLVPPQFMKGRLGAPKFKSLKRTIPEEEIVADKAKKVKSQGNYMKIDFTVYLRCCNTEKINTLQFYIPSGVK